MKKTAFLGAAALLSGMAFAAPSVVITGVAANANGGGLVDITYTVSGSESGYLLKFTVGAVVASNFTDYAWCDLPMADGAQTVTWDSKADGVTTPDLGSSSAAFETVTATMADADYMIVDTSAGKDAASYAVRYVKAGPNVTTAQFNKPEYKIHKIVFKRVRVGDFMTTTVGGVDYPYTFKMGVGQVATGTAWHPVRLTKDYFLGVFELTQQQHKDVTGANPSFVTSKETALASIAAEITDYTMHPVNKLAYDTISGSDGLFPRLTARTGLTIGAPTEAQWEYACRAGCENKYHWGADAETTEGELVEDRYGWNNLASAPNAGTGRTTHGVGELLPNAWGFYDMTGNIYEYCSDYYAAYAPNSTSAPEQDPTGPASGSNRVIRGGGFAHQVGYMASGSRNQQASNSNGGGGYGGYWAATMGVRLAVTVEVE